MENNLKPGDIKQESCGVEIKEEVFFELIEEQSCIDEIIKEESEIVNDIKEGKESFDLTCVQSFTSDILKEENLLINQIKKEDLNNLNVNDDEEFIQEEEEIDYVWPEDSIKEIDPLALPEIKCVVHQSPLSKALITRSSTESKTSIVPNNLMNSFYF